MAALDRNTLWLYTGCDVTERSPMCLHRIVNKPMCLLSFRWFWKAEYLNVQKKKIKRRMFHVYLLFTIYANITNVIKENHYDCFMFLFTLLIRTFHVYLLFTIREYYKYNIPEHSRKRKLNKYLGFDLIWNFIRNK